MTFTVFPEDRGLIMEGAPTGTLPLLTGAFDLQPGILGMPHTLDNAIRLTSLGYTCPAPIAYYYDFPREVSMVPQPFKHQIETAAHLTLHPRDYCLNDIGTGKTLSALWAADYLMSIGVIRRCLIVSPLSTLERVWADAIFFHLRHRSAIVLHGAAARRRKLLADPRDFYIINHDGIGVLNNELRERDDIDLVIIDELATYRNRQTTKWKDIDRVLHPDKGRAKTWVWGLTGTPIPNEPTDAYGQCRLVTTSSVPRYYTHFRNMVMEQQSMYVWTPRKEALDIVYKAMRPAIRFSRDECLDLPPCIYQTREVVLSAEQGKHYKAIMKELYTEVQGGKITAVNEGVKRSKLLQVACGVVYDTNGVPHEIDAGTRVNVLMELIEQINEKVIVFVPFTAVTAMLHRELRKHWNFEVVTGSTPVKQRNEIFARFQQKDSDLDLIAHPECMSHGLTLTEASTIIWYAPIDSNEIYEQANGRITRAGQKHTANIIHLAGSTIEHRMYKRLEQRQSTQGLLLDMVARGEE